MDSVVDPVVHALRSAPAIAPPPQRRRASSDLWRMLPYLMPYRARWIAMVTVAIASLAATVAIPLMTKAVIDGPVRHQNPQGLWLLGAAAMGVGICEAVLWFIRRWLAARATMGVEADIRKDLYARLQILPMSFHGRWQSGQLLSRIMNDLSTIRRFMSFGLLFLLLNGLQITVVTVILLAMYWPLGVVVVVSIVPITLTILHFQQEYTRLSRLAQDQAGHVATHVEESALGLRVVKSFGREDYVYDRFDEQLTNLYDTQLDRVSVSAKFWTLLEVIPNLTLIVVLGFGAYAAGHGHVTMGTLVAFITMMLSLVWPIASLGFLLSMTQESFTAANRIAEIFDAPREIVDGTVDQPPRGGRLELIDVGFRFPDAAPDEVAPSGEPDNWALRHVTVTVEPGETLALVGSTGAGKSVLAALLSRLYDVTEGAICIDGRDIRELSLPALRQTVATAFEDPTLFSMSVAENLALGRPRENPATDAELRQAVEVAAAQFVYDLPFGLDTRIGEQGMSLSGGQRQRLSLARAILAAPKILVLDDTLSALDVHTEAVVEEALRRVLHSVTGIVVAHRASTVLLADKVALLENGTITHVGTHAELLAGVPQYRYLLAADDELDDGCERIPTWEDEEDRTRLDHLVEEEPPRRPLLARGPNVTSESERR
ncbi:MULTISPECIES: ABC transporter ATP-binding protein [unclassified Mycobacterium]|uniref:ABC transporter ATP-binding protein n=1 Tax=unclassified Mycobacterium TaxID=2642494 RepID=UPI000740518F|nr:MULTISPECIES: ABC transporter ATP-binding protein [unclassified Mycobacterium]KUH80916.1 ABC transporter [Mycobacterium sp. GA-0227b]KUH86062.1 ABC transporter [Mycobacterium sp. IS-1556]KUH92289.1 ABC transporter [Mycobacterium sp. GA-1999]